MFYKVIEKSKTTGRVWCTIFDGFGQVLLMIHESKTYYYSTYFKGSSFKIQNLTCLDLLDWIEKELIVYKTDLSQFDLKLKLSETEFNPTEDQLLFNEFLQALAY